MSDTVDATSGGRGTISFSQAYFRRWGIGASQGRRLLLELRCGYIACTRLVKGQELEQKTGRREPHW